MTKTLLPAFLCLSLLVTSERAFAGGKPDGASCHVSKSCRSKLCVTLNPTDKFGVCCTPQDCAGLGAQCGSIDDGCGVPINCGSCDPGSSCENNVCVPGTTTTTSTTTTSTTTTSTSTTSSTTSSTTTTSSTLSTSTTLADQLIDLSLSNTPFPSGVGSNGTTVTFTLTVKNAGPDTATGVAVTDILPPAFTFDSSSASQGSYDSTSGVWSVGTVTTALDATLGITTHPTSCAGGPYNFSTQTNTAEVTAADQVDSDSIPDNANSAEDDLAIASVFFGCD